jgi:superfamily II DNA or RNA helicase
MSLQIKWDNVKRQGIIKGDCFDSLREHFSVENTSARFARYRSRFISPRKYAITATGRFDSGLYFEIKKYLIDEQISERIHVDDKFLEDIRPSYNLKPVFDQHALNLRDYQKDIVSSCLDNGRGVVVLATAGGKTLTIANIIENIFNSNKKLRALLIVPDLGLVNQTFKDFQEYNTSFLHSKWTGSDKLDIRSNVIIANMGILQSSKSDLSWLNSIDLLIVDEVHKLRRGNKINKIIKHIKTPHKFGFTGTMPEDLLDQWNIIGKIGPLLFEKNSYQLRLEKHVANAYIQILKLEYNQRPEVSRRTNPSEGYRNELEFLAKSTFRNNILTKLCTNINNNALILIDYINHGEILYDTLQRECKNKRVFFIRGDVDVKDREDVRQLMEDNNDIIVVAISKIFSTGINIKNLHYIIFAGGGKAKVRIIQSIGRGLRKHKDKKKVIIIDIADQLKYGYAHMKKRISLYKKEKINYGAKTIKEN